MVAYTAVAQSYLTGNHDLVTGLGGSVGFGENSLERNDDGSTDAINITSLFGAAGLDFFGTNYLTIFLNNNGNITFASPTPEYTPTAITGGTNNPIIAAYWADVDTRGPSGAVTPGGASRGTNLLYYDLDTVNRTFTATWDDVGYFSNHTDKQSAFQIQLVAQTDGTFDIVYRYENISWSAGDASGGSGGLGGTVARAGYSSGNGNAYFELPQSGNESQMLALGGTAGNTGIAGLWDFHVSSSTSGNEQVVRGSAAPDILFGGGNSDTIVGFAGDDQLFGADGNDWLAGGAGNDFIDGGSGSNTAFYQGARTEYTITPGTAAGSWTVADSTALRDGTDSLTNINNLSFAPVPTYRFFDTHDGGHFFTQSAAERDTVLVTRPDLRFEGMSFLALDQGNPLATPVFRFFDTNDGGHFFTTNTTERDTVLATRPDLRAEGVGFLESAVAASGLLPVFRFFDGHDGGHFFTQSTIERDTVLATRADLRPEGIAYYAPSGSVDNIFSL